jgi:hypothetical protein
LKPEPAGAFAIEKVVRDVFISRSGWPFAPSILLCYLDQQKTTKKITHTEIFRDAFANMPSFGVSSVNAPIARRKQQLIPGTDLVVVFRMLKPFKGRFARHEHMES